MTQLSWPAFFVYRPIENRMSEVIPIGKGFKQHNSN